MGPTRKRTLCSLSSSLNVTDWLNRCDDVSCVQMRKMPRWAHFRYASIPTSGRNIRRCLQDHVTRLHPDHEGDWRDLIGQKIMKEKRLGTARKRSGADNTRPRYGIPLVRPSRTTRQQLHPMPTLTPQSALNRTSTEYYGGQKLDSQFPFSERSDTVGKAALEGDDPQDNSSFISSSQSAKSKATKILEGLHNDTSVIISIDDWDQSAIAGRLGEKVQRLAMLAFPTDLFYDDFTVCSISDEATLKHMLEFYQEKADKCEEEARD